MNIELLKEEINNRSLSISELSKISNVDKSTISRLLSEERKCSISTAQALVNALDISSEKAGAIFFGNKVAKMQQSKEIEHDNY